MQNISKDSKRADFNSTQYQVLTELKAKITKTLDDFTYASAKLTTELRETEEFLENIVSVTKHPNYKRHLLIAEARTLTYEIMNEIAVDGFRERDGNYYYKHNVLIPKFHVNRKKRTVVCQLIGARVPKQVGKPAVVKCMDGDVFNESIGKCIALHRALGIEVPRKFTHAVQPTELEPGFIVYDSGNFSFGVATVLEVRPPNFFDHDKGYTLKCDGSTDERDGWAYIHRAVILDDTDGKENTL